MKLTDLSLSLAASSWASVLDFTSWCECIGPHSHILSQEKARRMGGESLVLFEATFPMTDTSYEAPPLKGILHFAEAPPERQAFHVWPSGRHCS